MFEKIGLFHAFKNFARKFDHSLIFVFFYVSRLPYCPYPAFIYSFYEVNISESNVYVKIRAPTNAHMPHILRMKTFTTIPAQDIPPVPHTYSHSRLLIPIYNPFTQCHSLPLLFDKYVFLTAMIPILL